jgi:hypothetical protein
MIIIDILTRQNRIVLHIQESYCLVLTDRGILAQSLTSVVEMGGEQVCGECPPLSIG